MNLTTFQAGILLPATPPFDAMRGVPHAHKRHEAPFSKTTFVTVTHGCYLWLCLDPSGAALRKELGVYFL